MCKNVVPALTNITKLRHWSVISLIDTFCLNDLSVVGANEIRGIVRTTLQIEPLGLAAVHARSRRYERSTKGKYGV